MLDGYKKPMLYLAGPYTHPDPVENAHKMCRMATIIQDEGKWLPFIPHLNMLWHTVCPQPEKYWYDIDLEYLLKCDAIVQVPRPSEGADYEMAFAFYHNIEIIDFASLPLKAQEIWSE